MNIVKSIIFVSTMLLLSAQTVNAQSELIYECPFAGSGGDFISRGFYLDNYPGSTLDTVVMRMLPTASTDYSITLTAREGTYDGPLIGTADVNSFLNNTETEITFNFGNVAVTPGTTVTFSISATGGSLYYDVGSGPCSDITQTNGTTPPLDTTRRATVGIQITGTPGDVTVVPGGITVSAISGNTTEAGGTATFTVVLDSQPTASVSIDLSSDNPAEGTVAPATLVFDDTNWDTPQVVTVTGQNDDIVDGDIVFNIVTSPAVSSDNAYAGIDADDVSVVNEDDDVVPVVPPAAPPVPVPTMSDLALLLMASLILLLAFRHKRVR